MEREGSSSSPRPQSHSHAVAISAAAAAAAAAARANSSSTAHHQAHQAHQAQAAATAAAFNYSAFLNAASVGDSSSVMLSSTENLLRNIQSLLKVAAENARQQDRQANYEKGKVKTTTTFQCQCHFPFSPFSSFSSFWLLSFVVVSFI